MKQAGFRYEDKLLTAFKSECDSLGISYVKGINDVLRKLYFPKEHNNMFGLKRDKAKQEKVNE